MMDKEPVRALIFGHSHVWAIKRALPGARAELDYRPQVILCGTRQFPSNTYLMTLSGRPALNPALMSAFATADKRPEDWLVSAVQGNYYNQLAMFLTDPGIDFVLPGHTGLPLDPDGVVLPFGAVRESMAAQMSEMPEFIRMLSGQAPQGQVIALGPPPLRDDEMIRELRLRADAEARISPPFLRLKMWLLQNQMMQQICTRNGVHYLAGDLPGTTDADGFLKPEFGKDAVHADHVYGALTLRQIGTLIARAPVAGETA